MLLLFLALSLLTGCGVKTVEVIKKDVYGEQSIGIPLDLIDSQEQCSKSRYARFFPVEVISDGREVPRYSEALGSKTRIVQRMDYGGEFHADSELALLLFPDVVKKAKEFGLCKTEFPFEKNSYQDAALSIVAPIKAFEKKFSSLVKQLALPKVKIRTAPRMKRGEKYLVNNAFYYSGTQEITFLPQGFADSESKTLPFQGKPFWKFPMVSLHEYGHHIFAHIYKKAAPDTESTSELPPSPDSHTEHSALCFDNSSLISSTKNSPANKRRSVTKVLAINTINEGFADLFAYYADEAARGLEGMGCLSKSRDVRYDSFRSGDRKILTKNALADFFKDEKISYASCSEETNFQDEHMIGAIFARAIYNSLESTHLDDKQKIELLIDWIKSSTSLFYKYDSPGDILKISIRQFHQTIRKRSLFTSAECRVFYSYFKGVMPNQCT